MSVASPPAWGDPSGATPDIQSGIWTSIAIDAICSDLMIAGGSDGKSGVLGKVNQLTNPGMEVWQRGAGPYSTNLTYTADRWLINLGGTSTVTVARDTTNFDVGSQYAMSTIYVHNSASYMSQRLENYMQYRSMVMTFSARVKTTTANSARLGVFDGTQTALSAYHSGGGAYETLSVTITVAAAAANVDVQLRMEASATIFWDNTTFITGLAPLPYSPLPPQDEMARCQRYYEVIGINTSSIVAEGIATAGTQTARCNLPFKQTKPVIPTLTRVGTWTLVNCSGQPTIAGDTTTCYLTISSTAAGQFNAANSAASCYVTAEANPA